MYPGMMQGMQMPHQEEMTEEQKAEMEARAKEEEKRRRKAQIESLKTQIKAKMIPAVEFLPETAVSCQVTDFQQK